MCLGLTDRRDQRRLGINHVLSLDSDADADCRRSRGGGKTLRLLIREVHDMRRSEWRWRHQSKRSQNMYRAVVEQSVSGVRHSVQQNWLRRRGGCERDTDRQQLS